MLFDSFFTAREFTKQNGFSLKKTVIQHKVYCVIMLPMPQKFPGMKLVVCGKACISQSMVQQQFFVKILLRDFRDFYSSPFSELK